MDDPNAQSTPLGKTVLNLLLTAAAVYGLIVAYFYFNQRNLLYYPTPPIDARHANNMVVTSDGEEIHVWHANDAASQALLYFGGNAESAALAVDWWSRLLPDYAVYAVSYRGYGRSTGTPSEDGLIADAHAVYDHVRANHREVSVVGRSLGSGVAISLATEREISRLLLITPYDSLASVGQGHFPYLPVKWLLKDKFDAGSLAASVTAPTLLLAAGNDRVIPPRHAKRLSEQFANPIAELRLIPSATHDSITDSPEVMVLLQGFLSADQPSGHRGGSQSY